jgi:hypothetical protein
MNWIRPRYEVVQALADQRAALQASCKSYDEGNQWEAARLANAVCTVVQDDGKHYTSLLKQLGIKSSLRFISSCLPMVKRGGRQQGLVSIRISGDTRTGEANAVYVPMLGSSPFKKRLQFPRWWDEVVLCDHKGDLTRKRLVFALRNQEGGSHFDPVLRNPHYARLARESESTPKLIMENKSAPALGVELASMRQIAWELLETLECVEPQ